jgi:2,6-dihydroxypseudooxynicotine hydrolase
MQVRSGRLDTLVPHLLRGQLLRPGFVRLSLQLGVARQMPAWAKLQFINHGVGPDELDEVLGRVVGLESWVDAWEALAVRRELAGVEALERGDTAAGAAQLLAASAAYNFAQYVMFIEPQRKQSLHAGCVRSYAAASPHFDPPVVPFDVPFRGRTVRGALRVPRGDGPRPVVALFHGTNGVKEELHWWSDHLVARGLAVLSFDGPGLGQTFHRLSSVAEPRPLGVAIVNHIETHPDLDPDAVAFMGLSLGGYCVLRMAAHD